MASGHITSWVMVGGKIKIRTDFLFFWALKSLRKVTAAMKVKDACSLEEKLRQTQRAY